MKLKIAFAAFASCILLAACSDQSTSTIQPPPPTPESQITTSSSQTTLTFSATEEQSQENSKTPTLSVTPVPLDDADLVGSPDDPQLALPKKGDTIAIIDTDLGTMKMKIFEKDVPELSKNFETLVKTGKYTDVPFHRVIKDFMIQTGDFTNKNGTGGYSYKGLGHDLANEINPKYHHLYGTVSMAKTNAPVSIGSQFFIVTNKDGYPSLDGNYSPIGQIYEGMDVAEKIADLQENLGSDDGTPSKIVNIKKITLSKYDGK